MRGAFLIDGTAGEPFDGVDVWSVHLTEELAGVGGGDPRSGADLRQKSCRKPAGFAGAGQTGQDDQPIARDFHGDILGCVRARR